MRWPSGWGNPSALALLQGTSINYLLVEKGAALEQVVAQAKKEGIGVSEFATPPQGVTIIDGAWPGVEIAKAGAVTAGPTGVPWVDSNGWAIRLSTALHPKSAVWVDAVPKEPRLFSQSYITALADAAARGGRWIISLDDQLASAVAAEKPDALESWKRISRAAGFFAAQEAWTDYVPGAVIGVVSDYSGENEFLSHELLNLLDRTNEQYRIVPKAATPVDLRGLKAVIYPDAVPPSPGLRKSILEFVAAGGLLITGSQWGHAPGISTEHNGHRRYVFHALGKGRVAMAKADLDDAYILANDSVLLVSHQHDLLRFWNGGAVGSLLTMAPDRRQALVQMLFYSERGNLQRGGMGEVLTLSVAGRFRSARIRTLNQPDPRPLEMEPLKDSVEVHFPAVASYAAIELDV